jgi:hypothetical protein
VVRIDDRVLEVLDRETEETTVIFRFVFSDSLRKSMQDVGIQAEVVGVLLFKEWCYFGTLESKADWAQVRYGSNAMFVVRGVGSKCMDDGDLESWVLMDKDAVGVYRTVAYGIIDDGPSRSKWYWESYKDSLKTRPN